jgi:hypothetical protein
LKIKNKTDVTIYDLKIIVYFHDKDGKIFYEETRHVIDSDSWTDPVILKPNYSILYPEADESIYSTVDKMDLNEWDEGKITIEINDIKITPSD